MSSSIQLYPSLLLIQQIITNYGFPFVIVFGTLGNLLNILLFFRKALRTTSCNNYFLASAFANLVVLNVGIISLLYTYYRPWTITETYCKIRSYTFNVSQQISRFFIVAACFDRFALCSTSVRLRQFCRVQIARRYVIPSMIIIWLILPLHMTIFSIVINHSCTYSGVPALYHSIYGITMVGFIPPTLMFIFSLLIFRNLKSRQQRQQVRLFAIVNAHLLTNINRQQQKKDQQVLGMLMIQVVVYVSTATVSAINLLYSTLTTYLGINKSNERKSIEAFISSITGILIYSSPCLSFYLYILISRFYRKQMKLVMLHICRRCCFPWTGGNNNNNNVGVHVPMRQLTARVQPIQQPSAIPFSSMAK